MPALARTGSQWDWSTVTAGDGGPAPFGLGPPAISYPVFYLSCLHDPDRQKQLAYRLFDLGQGLLKTNTHKPRNMVICSGWVKECGFINTGANQPHIKLRLRFFFSLGGRRGVHCGVRWMGGYSIRAWLLFQKGTRGTYRLSVSRHWQPRRLTLHASPWGEMGIWHACAWIHVYMDVYMFGQARRRMSVSSKAFILFNNGWVK